LWQQKLKKMVMSTRLYNKQMLEKCDANAEKMLLMRESTGQKEEQAPAIEGAMFISRDKTKLKVEETRGKLEESLPSNCESYESLPLHPLV